MSSSGALASRSEKEHTRPPGRLWPEDGQSHPSSKLYQILLRKHVDLYDGEGGPQEACNLHIEEEEGAMPGDGDLLFQDSPSVLLLWDPSHTNRHSLGF